MVTTKTLADVTAVDGLTISIYTTIATDDLGGAGPKYVHIKSRDYYIDGTHVTLEELAQRSPRFALSASLYGGL